MWTCPECGRSFASRNQAHACAALGDLDRHFAGASPQVRATFDAVLTSAQESSRPAAKRSSASASISWSCRYLMATALAGEPIPPGAFSGALTRNIS